MPAEEEREDWYRCPDCELRFTVTACNDQDIMDGNPFVLYCPRCGSEDIGGPIDYWSSPLLSAERKEEEEEDLEAKT